MVYIGIVSCNSHLLLQLQRPFRLANHIGQLGEGRLRRHVVAGYDAHIAEHLARIIDLRHGTIWALCAIDDDDSSIVGCSQLIHEILAI